MPPRLDTTSVASQAFSGGNVFSGLEKQNPHFQNKNKANMVLFVLCPVKGAGPLAGRHSSAANKFLDGILDWVSRERDGFASYRPVKG